MDSEGMRRFFQRPQRLSYVFMLLLVVATVWLRLPVLLVSALFSYLALDLLRFGGRVSKWLSLSLFLVLLVFGGYGFVRIVHHGVAALPEIANKGIPAFIDWIKKYGIDTNFKDFDSLRDSLIGTAGQAEHLGSFARGVRDAGTRALYVVAGVVVAISLFLNPRFELGRDAHVKPNNLYSLACEHLAVRFRRFYESFSTVIGAQILISAINAVLTGIFALVVHLPHIPFVVSLTFALGLLPVVGNLLSNTIVVFIGFTVSPDMAISALVFLVVIHKLEYFLNSKIIGQRIRNPLWLTLIGLIVGERIMGLSGIILAPVILHYLKQEASSFEVPPAQDKIS